MREAQILCKPVIITHYPTSGSQVMNGVDGVICDLDSESVAQAIMDHLINDEKKRELINHLKTHDYGNESEVEIIYGLIG